MKLNIKLALYIALLTIVSSAIVSAFSYQSIQKMVESDAEASVVSLVGTVSSMVSTAAYLNNVELASEAIAGLEVNAIVACVKIVTRSMVAVGENTCSSDPFYQKAIYSPFDKDDYLGDIFVYEAPSIIRQKTNIRIYRELLSIVQVILLISGIILITTYLLITKPVERLANRLKSISFQGDRIERLPDNPRQDEIGYISNVINQLLDDASSRIKKERSLTRRAAQLTTHFKTVFDLSSNALAVTDETLKLESFNKRFEELVTTNNSSVDVGEHSCAWVEGVAINSESVRDVILSAPLSEEPNSLEVEYRQPGQASVLTKFYTLTFVKTRNEKSGIMVLIFINDMTEHRNQLLVSEYNANHDNLTSLLNRRAATNEIKCLIESVKDKKNKKDLALLMIDLDGFKEVNDAYGHESGDKILQVVSQRLSKTTRKSDTVSRWGGDEFLVVLNEVSLEQAKSIADKMLEAVLQPINMHDGIKIKGVGASVGMVMYKDCNSGFTDWFELADKTMYKVKHGGRRAVLVYDKRIHSLGKDR